MSDPQIEYVEVLLELDEHHRVLVEKVNQLKECGPEGIREVVQKDPQIILIAFDALVQLAQASHDAHKEVAEMFLQTIDELESIESQS